MRSEGEAERYWREVDNCMRLAAGALSEAARRHWRELAVRYTDLALEAGDLEAGRPVRIGTQHLRPRPEAQINSK
jgi:hypothetical protein